MKLQQYEEITSQDDVLSEDILKGIRVVLIEERNLFYRHIEGILDKDPIERPPPELGMSKFMHFHVDLKPPKARKILTTLRNAESMYGPRARFGDCPIGSLTTEWSGYCKSISR